MHPAAEADSDGPRTRCRQGWPILALEGSLRGPLVRGVGAWVEAGRMGWRWARVLGGWVAILWDLGWPVGFEPTTCGSTIRCSAVELRPPRASSARGRRERREY